MIHRIDIRSKEGFGDPHAEGVLAQIRELGIQADSVSQVRSARLFFLVGDISAEQARQAAEDLLTDPVVEQYRIDEGDGGGQTDGGEGGNTNGEAAGNKGGNADGQAAAAQAVIEVHLKPGVMDPVAASTEQAIRDMGLAVTSVRTGRRYELSGSIDDATREAIARRLLANPVIEDIHYAAHTPPEVQGRGYELKIIDVPIRDLDEKALVKLAADNEMFLNITEMKAIQDYFRRIGREPRDVELEMIAQTWSEHCVHKTFRSDVLVRDNAGREVERFENLIKSTVFKATKDLAKPWCLSVFEDNAGVIEFDESHAVCFKVETHNHPSAIEPYGGAATGIGGVVRDPMGTGLGAEPVANTDIFCFGPPDMPLESVPKGVLHPRRVMRGVVGGVRDYGNRMGIPTVNGAVYFDEKYLGNPLVFCGTVGMLPIDKCRKRRPSPGDAIVCVGGRTGRDGIHGATFSSGELTHQHETEFSHAVQIGNAITEKKMLDTIVQARDLGLYSCITDCGAGGLSSAVGEMGETTGAEVHIDRVPLKYAGLTYSETWISEAQERMVLAVPPQNVQRILKIFSDEGVEATVIGTYGTEGRMLRLYYAGQLVGELEMDLLHEGCPRPTKPAVYEKVERPSPAPRARKNYNDTLLAILSAVNVASKEWIIRQYDHEVQGGSAIKPLVGVGGDGPGDAAVIRPVLSSRKGVVISCGMNPRLGDLDPYQSALHAVDEALRNAVSVGANLDRTAILDNFCWGNCNKPDRMGTFVQSAKGCRDAALGYSTPFISGKDSLNNEFQTEAGQTIAIPATLLISAISVIDDVSRCVTADAKAAGNFLMLLGRTAPQLGGSHYLLVEGLQTGNDVPPVDLPTNLKVMRAVQAAIQAGAVRACHDLSEGGLAVAAAEMALAGGLGVELDLAAVPTTDNSVGDQARLFAESAGRLLVEVAPDKYDAFMRIVKDCPVGEVGRVTGTGRVVIKGQAGTVIDLPAADAKAAWQKTFDW
jgi:phosphoribosylformylglycinamidine synthase